MDNKELLLEICKRVKLAIDKSGLSYGELSNKTGISKSALQRYATGETLKIPMDRINTIAEATGVSSAWIMGWEEEKPVPEETSRADEFVKLFGKLTVEQQKMIIAQIKGILSNQ